MALNDKYFVPPDATETLLRARGFGANGQRSGGIERPQIADLASGTVLFRMYHDPARDYGEWWATPRELAAIGDYFGRGGSAFDEGRSRAFCTPRWRCGTTGAATARYIWECSSPSDFRRR